MAGRHEFKLENGTKFFIRRYDVFLSLEVLGDVQKRFLGPLAMLTEAIDKSNPAEVRERFSQTAIENFSKNLDGPALTYLVKRVLNPEYVSVSIDDRPPEQLEEGQLNLAVDSVYDVIALVFEVLRYNYEDLFTRGRTLIGKAQGLQQVIH